MERKLAAILAVDVVGYSWLMGADKAGTLATLQSLRAEFIDPTITKYPNLRRCIFAFQRAAP